MAPGAGENDEKKTTKDSYPRHLSKTMETSHHAEGLGILMAHAPAGPHDEGCQGHPSPDQRRERASVCVPWSNGSALICIIFKTLSIFSKSSFRQKEGKCFYTSAGHLGLGISLEGTESFAFCGVLSPLGLHV